MLQMRQAGILVWHAHQLGRRGGPAGRDDRRDRRGDRGVLRRATTPCRCSRAFPARFRFPPSTCISVNEEVVHGIPSQRMLKEGDIVSIDTGCKLNGWCGDSAYTHPVGRVSPEVQRLLDVTNGVLDLAIELMGRKSRWSEVAREMATYVRDTGFSVVENFVGHGIGREMHEDPQVPNFVSPQLRRNNDFRLEPGLVIAVEPMVNMGTKKVRADARPLDPIDAGRPAERPFRAHDRDHRQRAVDSAGLLRARLKVWWSTTR